MTSTADLCLLPQHMADLRRSGLSEAQMRACRFTSLNGQHDVADILHWQSPAKSIMPVLVFPFFGADGKETGYCRIKPDKPRHDKNGKPIKYESPIGEGNRAYFPPYTRTVLQDAETQLLITEGEKKAAKADQEGFACIGLVGTWGWQKKRDRDQDGKPIGARELIDDLLCVNWQSRNVCIVFDSDAASKPEIQWAEWHLSQALAQQGALVKIVRLPAGDQEKVGLDDFLVAQGATALGELLDRASLPQRPARDKPNEGPTDPHRLARLYLHKTKDRTLRFWNGEFHRYEQDHYEPIGEKELRGDVTRIVKNELDRINLLALAKPQEKDKGPPRTHQTTRRLIGDVLHALASLRLVPSKIKQPAWLGTPGPFLPGEILAAKNHLVHLSSLVAGKPYLCRHTPQFFSPNVLDYDFQADAPEPTRWLKFLHEDLWPNDPQSINALQEFFGYCLLPDTRQHKILLIVGPKRSGKGTIARVLRAVVGPLNTCGPTLASLGANFGLWPLLGKTVGIISDARLSNRTDAAVVMERLLSISGEDPQTIDRKNLPHVHTILTVRFIILTNELPRLNDPSGALVGRMILLRQTTSWYGHEDTRLTNKLLTELPGILHWSIEGFRRLHERGHFVQPATSALLLENMEDLTSPVGAFLRDRCQIGDAFEVFVRDIFDSWKQWCEEVGRKDAGNLQTFGRDLHAAVPTLMCRQTRTLGTLVRKYQGLRLRNEGDNSG